MTQKELLELENLKIAEVKPNMFVHVHTNDGYFITSWTENDDIKDYSGSTCMWLPIRDSYIDYRIITLAEHEEYETRQKEAFENEIKSV